MLLKLLTQANSLMHLSIKIRGNNFTGDILFVNRFHRINYNLFVI